jgi:nucleoside-diphosphate-sugar epimerase
MWTGLHLVHAGSALEYGSIADPLVEDMPRMPETAYGNTKWAGTQIVARAAAGGLRAATACLFTIYGPGEHSDRLLPSLMETARSQKRLSLTSGAQKRDFTFIEDAAEGLLRLGLADPPEGSIVNIATGRLTSVRQFAETASGVLGFDRALLGFGDVPTRPGESFHGPVVIGRLERLLGWKPETLVADGIRRTWEAAGGR